VPYPSSNLPIFLKVNFHSQRKGCFKASANQRVHSYPVSNYKFLLFHLEENANFVLYTLKSICKSVSMKCLKTCFTFVDISEKSKLKEDILARRQKKLLMRHDRQKYLEEAALREAEILQELDRY